MKRENVKWIEVNYRTTWRKRIFIEQTPDNGCLYIYKSDEENYKNYGAFTVIPVSSEQWREIAEPEYVPYGDFEDFKYRLMDGWLKENESQDLFRILYASKCCIATIHRGDVKLFNYNEMLRYFVWYSDGSPCGKLKGE